MSDKLYINGREIELSPDDPVGFTYQANDIAQISEPQASYSNRFSPPDTNGNNVALNHSGNVSTNTLMPYRKLPCTFIRNGVAIIENGIAIIEGFSSNYEITIYSGIFYFFDQLGNKTLKDINWSFLDHSYDLSSIRTINTDYCTRPQRSDHLWPLIQWGPHIVNQPIDIKYQQPCLRQTIIIDKIFELTTYAKDGEIFSDGMYQDMALTLSPDEYEVSQDVLDSRSFRATLQDTSVRMWTDIGLPSAYGTTSNVLSFMDYTAGGGRPAPNNIVYDYSGPGIANNGRAGIENAGPRGSNPLSNSRYVSNFYGTIRINTQLFFQYLKVNPASYYFIYKNNQIVSITSLADLGPIDTYVATFFQSETSIDVKPGDIIRIYFSHGTTGFFIQGHDYGVSYINITAVDTISLGTILDYNRLVPELKLKDIIRSLCETFGLVITVSKTSQTIIFTKFLEQKKNIDKAENWSNKLDLTIKPAITYRIGSYGQKNNMKYAPDDYTNGFGDSSFYINDTVLQPESNQVELIYPSALPFGNIQNTYAGTNEGIKIDRYTLFDAESYNSIEDYAVGDIVNYQDRIWISLQDNNINHTPVTGAYWELKNLQYEQSITSASRMVLIRPLTPLDHLDSITYTDGVNTLVTNSSVLPLAYFSDGLMPYNLTWQYLLDAYYREYQDMLNQLKVVNCLINLSELDIKQLDFILLKYIEHFGNYFYLNRVDEYIEGQSTNCQLLRL